MIVWMVWFLSKFSWVSIILLGIYLPHGILFWISRDFGQHPQLRNSQFHGFGEASPPEKKSECECFTNLQMPQTKTRN